MKQLDIVRPCILITSDTSEDVCRDAQMLRLFQSEEAGPRRSLLKRSRQR